MLLFELTAAKYIPAVYGYDVAYRVDSDKVFSVSFGYNVAYRVDR
jgi:hypothetical protein